MVKMENISAVFALGMMENKVHIVGRSSTDEVDVGCILSALGGGGHPSAASAAIKDQTLAQVENALLKELQQQIKSQRLAQHIMSSPAISAGPEMSCAQANQMLTRYNINALLVISNNTDKVKLLGYITRQVIEKAIFHNLGHLPIKDYMNTELMEVAPEAELFEVQEKIIGNKQRILPVANDTGILGVITRTDLLTVLVQQTQMTRDTVSDPTRNRINARTRIISNYMKERLPQEILNTLVGVGEIAEKLKFEAYVVGGFVRDLFLYRTNEDIDIVIEGDGIAFAKAYAKATGARIHSHRKFGTAVVIFPDGHKIDVATARMEYYRSPAALPDVEMSSIKLDLFRRDFTINTLAINLNPKRFGRLIDFFGAQKDIKDKAIRVLHNLSFVEDPTRVFRAIRFEQRFGFAIGKLTVSLINNAVKMEFFKRLSGRRVFSELRLILEEENPTPAVSRMADFNLLQVVHPSLEVDDQLIILFNAVKSAMSWHDLLFVEEPYLRWTVYFMAMIKDCDMVTSKRICAELELAPRYSQLLCQNRIAAQQRLAKMEQGLPDTASELYHCLENFRTELILFMMAATTQKPVKKAISHYYNELRKVQPLIGGRDLIDMGLKPGIIFRQVLDAVQDAKLNGMVQTRDDEQLYAKKWIGRYTHHSTP
jgi:tRNA nucleotidyltransferase (CCA-adding enzyme)